MSKLFKIFRVKCYRCDYKFSFKHLHYAVRIPEQMKHAAICDECYKKRQGNAKPVGGLEFEDMLDLP